MSNFKIALKRVLKHEGGYVNDPKDKGGETNYGITIGTARQFGYTGSMRSIPMDVVEKIYKARFWDALGCDELADKYGFAFAFQLFDAGVNHGVGNAKRMLQRAVGVVDDGVIGKVTRQAIDDNAERLTDLFNAERIAFYTKISSFNHFGRGWMRRMSDNLRFVAKDSQITIKATTPNDVDSDTASELPNELA